MTTFDHDVVLGERGDHARWVNTALWHAGHVFPGVDGDEFSEYSLTYLQQFQRDHGLPETAVCDATTWAKLDEVWRFSAAAEPSPPEGTPAQLLGAAWESGDLETDARCLFEKLVNWDAGQVKDGGDWDLYIPAERVDTWFNAMVSDGWMDPPFTQHATDLLTNAVGFGDAEAIVRQVNLMAWSIRESIADARKLHATSGVWVPKDWQIQFVDWFNTRGTDPTHIFSCFMQG